METVPATGGSRTASLGFPSALWTKGDLVLGKTTATIDRERRGALYELVLDHLSGIGDFWIAIEEKDFAKAERLGIEFGEDFRLLEDIGWEPEHGPAKVALTIPSHDLIELLRRLHGEAGCVLEGSACGRLLEKEEESARQRYQRAKSTCEELIEQLDPRGAD
jgi:hypothetical protein